MEIFIASHINLWLIIIFFWMIITNIFPIMFFILPEIFIFWGIFLAKHINWYIPYLAIVLWAIIWEQINFYLGYKYWKKILKTKFFQHNLVEKYMNKLKNNQVKTIIIWKLIPGVIWIIPILSGILKINPIKFFIINSIMITLAILNMFLIWYFGIYVWEKFLWKNIYIITWIFILFLFFFHLFKIIKKTRNKS